MDRLRAYWIKPEFTNVRLIKDIEEAWSDENGGVINPSWFQANYPGICFFSKMEIGRNCWVKVWFFHWDLKSEFKTSKKREQYAYWIDPSWLVEIPL